MSFSGNTQTSTALRVSVVSFGTHALLDRRLTYKSESVTSEQDIAARRGRAWRENHWNRQRWRSPITPEPPSTDEGPHPASGRCTAPEAQHSSTSRQPAFHGCNQLHGDHCSSRGRMETNRILIQQHFDGLPTYAMAVFAQVQCSSMRCPSIHGQIWTQVGNLLVTRRWKAQVVNGHIHLLLES